MNKDRLYPWIGAVIGVLIGLAVLAMMEKRQGFLLNEKLLDLLIIGAAIGASIGAITDMLGKRDMFNDSISGIAAIIVFGAAIGAIFDPKFSQPVPRAIAGTITGIIAFVLYTKIIEHDITIKNRDVDEVRYAIFGMITGAIFGAAILIVGTIYSAIYFDDVIRANGYSIDSFIVNGIYPNVGFSIIIGGLLGTIFCLLFSAIHNAIRGKGAVGGAIIGSILLGELFQSFSGVILGVFTGAIVGEIGSKGKMGNMVAGATITGSFAALVSAIGWVDVVPTSTSLIIILPTFLIIGYHAGMIIGVNKADYPKFAEKNN